MSVGKGPCPRLTHTRNSACNEKPFSILYKKLICIKRWQWENSKDTVEAAL